MPAILHVTNSSQELGTAIADVLFGAYNPGGRTTTTWYRSETDIPTAITDYDIREGTTYWYFTGTPLYPFGHGLSYSTFAYANATASAPSLSSTSTPTCGAITIGVDVTNTGTVAGDEVAQLYVSYPGYRGRRAPAEAAARVPARQPGRGRDPARHLLAERGRSPLLGRRQRAVRGGDRRWSASRSARRPRTSAPTWTCASILDDRAPRSVPGRAAHAVFPFS